VRAEDGESGRPPGSPLQGGWAPAFAPVAEALRRQLVDGQHHGVALAVYHRGECVVDVWGGRRELPDGAGEAAWAEDTMAVILSATKGVLAVALHAALEETGTTCDTPVREVWSEFGDPRVTIAHVLSHSAGLPQVPDIVSDPWVMLDWDRMTKAVAALEPLWEPGARHGYHGLTFGWLAGELARRLTGRSPRESVEQLHDRLEMDGLFLGLPANERARVTTIQAPARPLDFALPSLRERSSLLRRSYISYSAIRSVVNSDQGMMAELPSFGIVATARSLAKLYLMLGQNGEYAGERILSPRAVARLACPVNAARPDLVLKYPISWTLGMMQRAGTRRVGTQSYGMPGFVGSIGFADPEADLAVGVVCDQGDERGYGSRRNFPIMNAVYEAIGRR
jgi:CubicO group peptidase (beta-lactamase class C family)